MCYCTKDHVKASVEKLAPPRTEQMTFLLVTTMARVEDAIGSSRKPAAASPFERLPPDVVVCVLEFVDLPVRVKVASCNSRLRKLVYADCRKLWFDIDLSNQEIVDSQLWSLLKQVHAKEVTRKLRLINCFLLDGTGLEPLRHSRVLTHFDMRGCDNSFQTIKVDILKTMIPHSLFDIRLPLTLNHPNFPKYGRVAMQFLRSLRAAKLQQTRQVQIACHACQDSVAGDRRQIISNITPADRCATCENYFCRKGSCMVDVRECLGCAVASCEGCGDVRRCDKCSHSYCKYCDDTSTCDICKIHKCDSCAEIDTCSICKTNLCDECDGDLEFCEKCEAWFCGECRTVQLCDLCGYLYCKTCGDPTCECCGISSCSDCRTCGDPTCESCSNCRMANDQSTYCLGCHRYYCPECSHNALKPISSCSCGARLCEMCRISSRDNEEDDLSRDLEEEECRGCHICGKGYCECVEVVHTCHDCERSFCEKCDEVRYCKDCPFLRYRCNACWCAKKGIRLCDRCNEHYCGGCQDLAKCSFCGEFHCDTCSSFVQCILCQGLHCQRCRSASGTDSVHSGSEFSCTGCKLTLRCNSCHTRVLSSLVNQCTACRGLFCKGCRTLDVCESCGKSSCNDDCGFIDYCEKCDTHFCEGCRLVVRCVWCGRTSCEKCKILGGNCLMCCETPSKKAKMFK